MSDASVRVIGCRSLLPVVLAALAAADLAAQANWSRRAPMNANGRMLAFDPVRRTVIGFGGYSPVVVVGGVWIWSNGRWNAVSPPNSPGSGIAMATDPARGEVLLVGALQDTWTWNGQVWQQRSLANSGWGYHTGFAVSVDPSRGRAVLFGGSLNGGTPNAETWEWDGTTWSLLTPAVSPSGRFGHRMVFDPVRGRTMLFGGRSVATSFSDTWEWDGVNWLQRTPASAPRARNGHAMTWDAARQRAVLYGGSVAGAPSGASETWEWDGTTWTQRTPVHSPGPPIWFDMAFDAATNRVVLWGTGAASGLSTWEWNGQDWTMTAPGTSPGGRVGAGLAYDWGRRVSTLFGGYAGGSVADTWEWDGEVWQLRTTTVHPPARDIVLNGMAHDPLRGATVLFGGSTGSTMFGDTWEWNGNVWTPMQPASAPSARGGHAMAFDLSLGKVLLFGGADSTGWLDETWTWDGAVWTLLSLANRPPARSGHGLAYDTAVGAGGMLLFGGAGAPFLPGTSAPTARNDTWRFTAGVWQQLTPATSPSPRYSMGMASDLSRSVVVVFGGVTAMTGPYDETWEWNGSNWSLMSPADRPYLRCFVPMTYDNARGHVLLFGGATSAYADDTWAYGPAGSQATYGAGCPGSLGASALVPGPVSLPTVGGRLSTQVTNVPRGLAVMGLEFADRGGSPVTVPQSLAALGMPGCNLWIRPAAWFLLAVSGNAAAWDLDIPFSPALFGAQLFQQALVFDPGTNSPGWIVSDAARWQIGL
jgi:hypothetical protein